MNNALYLLSVWGLIPLAVIAIALVGRPVLTLPHRLVKRLSPQHAYERSVIVLALAGALSVLYLTLHLAFNTGGQTFPQTAFLKLDGRIVYLLLLLFGVPLAVVGLIARGRRFLIWPSRLSFGLISEEGASALSSAALTVGGALAEVWLVVQLAAS
jgi:hypothetical protein